MKIDVTPHRVARQPGLETIKENEPLADLKETRGTNRMRLMRQQAMTNLRAHVWNVNVSFESLGVLMTINKKEFFK